MTEFLGNLEETPQLADEAAGELLVWRGEVIVAQYPWHTHVHVEGDRLYVFDVLTWRLLGQFEPGTWSKAANAP